AIKSDHKRSLFYIYFNWLPLKILYMITCYIPPIELQDEFSQIAKQIEQTIPHMSSFNDLDLFGSLNSKAFSGQL
ncbi:hypothetical protein, partial [Aeromonas veronii]